MLACILITKNYIQVSVSGGCTAYSQWACAVIGILASIGYIVWTGVFGFTKVDDVTGSITGICI